MVYKIREKGEPLFVYLGGLNGSTLGHGLIINNYSNMLDYPDKRHVGMQLDIDMGKAGIETLISDVNRNPVIGARVFIRPFRDSAVFFLDRLAIGFSAAADQNPDEYTKTDNDSVIIIGADLDLPIINSGGFQLLAYSDIAQMELGQIYRNTVKNHGRGYTVGLRGKIIELITHRLEYRILENNFIPGYFDAYYEIDRAGKPYTIADSSKPTKKGPYLEAGINILQKASVLFSYENYNIDTAEYYPYLQGRLNLDPSLLLNRFTFSATYSKRNVKDIQDFFDAKRSIMTTELGYNIAPQVNILIIQRQTFDSRGIPTKNTTFETRFMF